MDKLILIIKGMIAGLGKIIPGVSGSVLAMTLGIYDKCINYIANIFKTFKEAVFYLGWVGIGILISLCFGSNLVLYLLDNHYGLMMFFFIGLIAGGLPYLAKKGQVGVKKMSSICLFGLSFFLFFFFSIYVNNGVQKENYNFLILFLIGCLESFAMVVPGISGTALLITLGFYEMVMHEFSRLFFVFSHLNFFIPFGLGLVVGAYLTSKLICLCFKKFYKQTYLVIYALVISSIFVLLLQNFKVLSLINLVFLLIGLFLSLLFNKKFN
jgi:putative membrane protein